MCSILFAPKNPFTIFCFPKIVVEWYLWIYEKISTEKEICLKVLLDIFSNTFQIFILETFKNLTMNFTIHTPLNANVFPRDVMENVSLYSCKNNFMDTSRNLFRICLGRHWNRCLSNTVPAPSRSFSGFFQKITMS